MFIEQFTEGSREIIISARKEAIRLGSTNLKTEHLLLVLVNKEDCTAFRILIKLLSTINIHVIRHEAERRSVTNKCLDVNEEFASESFLDSLEDRSEEEIPEIRYKNDEDNNEDNSEIPFTDESRKVLELSIKECKFMNHSLVNTGHILLGLIKCGGGIAYTLLNDFNIDLIKARRELTNIIEYDSKAARREVKTEMLDKFSRDMTKEASEGKLDPVIGRDREIERLIQILCRRTKNNPVLIGEPGVGKTAIIEGLAQSIINKTVPSDLEGKRLISLDLGLLVSGTKYRGQFEERLTTILKEISKADLIIFIDELHTIIGTGSSEGSLDASNLLKPALARGDLQCIGATTINEYRKYIEKDGALERRFQQIVVEPTNIENTIEIINGLKTTYENFHDIEFDKDSIIQAVCLSDNYITDRFLPDKAIDVLDEAACYAKIHRRNDSCDKVIVTSDDIIHVITNWTGIPVNKMNDIDSDKINNLSSELSKVVIGQEEAIKSISDTIKRSRTGLKNPEKPIGSFMFVGPSGVGKTELCKCLAEYLFGRRDSIIQLDMSEYSQPFSISRLIGSPPGYVGFENGGQLTEKVRRKPHSIILLDEIEKADIEIINVFLQILEYGHITDGKGRTVNFKNTIIVMTSNIGKDVCIDNKSLGFKMVTPMDKQNEKKLLIREELKHKMPVEFLNRIDNIVVFETLTKENIYNIIDLEIEKLNKKLISRNLHVEIEPDSKTWILNNGFSEEYGARFLNRYIESNICNKISDGILSEKFQDGDDLSINIIDNKIEIMVLEGSSINGNI